MKKYLFSVSMLIPFLLIAQVGINTETPHATLDVTASPDNIELVDGVLVPRMSGDQLKSKDQLYGSDQHATLVYVTEVPNPPTAKTSLITEEGFYYYDAIDAVWKSNLIEPWNVRNTDNKSKLNSDNIYQMGSVAVGTKHGLDRFHVDGSKNNCCVTPDINEMLDDFLVHSTGRVYIGAKPNELLLLAGVEDKIKVAANQDLDVDYDLATTSNSQAIVHRNIISSGTMDNRGPRGRLRSIASFEGHTYREPNISTNFSWYQQRASIVLRTGRSTDDGGEIWFGTAGTGPNPKVAWYRAVMDEKGYWAFGADPNNEAYNPPTERLDVLYGGLRLRQLNSTQYTSVNSGDRIVVVDANGVLKSRPSNSLAASKSDNHKSIDKVSSSSNIHSDTTLANVADGDITLTIDSSQEVEGNRLIIKKIDQSKNIVNIKSASNKKIEFADTYKITEFLGGVEIQFHEDSWYVIGKL